MLTSRSLWVLLHVCCIYDQSRGGNDAPHAARACTPVTDWDASTLGLPDRPCTMQAMLGSPSDAAVFSAGLYQGSF